jgi:hypothetical protein
MKSLTKAKRLNVVIDCLTLVFSIRDVSGSNLCPDTGYPQCSVFNDAFSITKPTKYIVSNEIMISG